MLWDFFKEHFTVLIWIEIVGSCGFPQVVNHSIAIGWASTICGIAFIGVIQLMCIAIMEKNIVNREKDIVCILLSKSQV